MSTVNGLDQKINVLGGLETVTHSAIAEEKTTNGRTVED